MKIVHALGQTCNQFWIYSNFITDAIEKNEKFAIWIPDVAFENFPNLLNSEFISYPLYSEKLASFFGYKKYVKALKTIFGNKYAINFFNFVLNMLPNQSFIIADVLTEKSQFRHKNLEKLLSYYIPEDAVVLKVDTFMASVREEYEIIIGVHIRYGDYRTWNNGKYFYTLEQYSVFFKKISDVFISKKIAFYIVSNERIDTSFFKDYNYFYFSNRLMAEDLFSLSKADYIIGPPSTFSAWASLYGTVPLYFIESSNSDFKIPDFINIKDIWFQ